MSNAYDKGKTIRLSALFTVGGVATDPTTVTLKVKKPRGGIVTYTYALAEITKDSTGNYHKDVVGHEAGTRYHQWIRTSEDSRAMARAYESGYSDGGEDEPVSGTTKKYGYKRTTTAALRDFTKMDHASIIETVWSLWQSHPVAKRVLVIKRGYILGSGVHPQSGDPDLQGILTEFWMDNQLPRRSKEFTLQLFLFGEQCYPAYVRMADGKTSLGYIDPGSIRQEITPPET